MNAGKLQPCGDKLIVELIPDEQVTAGGVVIAPAFQERTTRGRVVSMGPGARGEDGERLPIEVEPGDVVIFSKYGGTELALDDDFLFLREADLMAILKEGSDGSEADAS